MIYCYPFSLPTALTHFPGLYTNNVHGISTVRIATSGVENKGFTIALCISALGERLQAFLIFKEWGGKFGSRVMKALTFPDNIQVLAFENGRMTRAELHRWLQIVWKDCDEHWLLVLDQYRPHWTTVTTYLAESFDTQLIFLPGWCTGIDQLLDISISSKLTSRSNG